MGRVGGFRAVVLAYLERVSLIVALVSTPAGVANEFSYVTLCPADYVNIGGACRHKNCGPGGDPNICNVPGVRVPIPYNTDPEPEPPVDTDYEPPPPPPPPGPTPDPGECYVDVKYDQVKVELDPQYIKAYEARRGFAPRIISPLDTILITVKYHYAPPPGCKKVIRGPSEKDLPKFVVNFYDRGKIIWDSRSHKNKFQLLQYVAGSHFQMRVVGGTQSWMDDEEALQKLLDSTQLGSNGLPFIAVEVISMAYGANKQKTVPYTSCVQVAGGANRRLSFVFKAVADTSITVKELTEFALETKTKGIEAIDPFRRLRKDVNYYVEMSRKPKENGLMNTCKRPPLTTYSIILKNNLTTGDAYLISGRPKASSSKVAGIAGNKGVLLDAEMLSPRNTIHEFGHVFGDLADEYTYLDQINPEDTFDGWADYVAMTEALPDRPYVAAVNCRSNPEAYSPSYYRGGPYLYCGAWAEGNKPPGVTGAMYRPSSDSIMRGNLYAETEGYVSKFNVPSCAAIMARWKTGRAARSIIYVPVPGGAPRRMELWETFVDECLAMDTIKD